MARSEFTSQVVFPALAAVAAASLAVGGAAARWRADPPAVPAAPRPAGEAKKDRGPVPAAAKPVASAPLDLGGYQCAVKNWKDAPVLAAVVRSPADWEAVHAATPVMGDDRPFGPDEGVFEDRQVLLVARVVDAGDGWERAVRVTGVSADGDALFVECVYSPPEAGATFTATAAAAVLVPRKEYKSVTFVEDGKVVATLKAGAVTNAKPDDE